MLTKKQDWWLGIAGSIASLIGLGLYFLPVNTPTNEPSTSQSSGVADSSMQQISEPKCSPNLAGAKVTGTLVVCDQQASQQGNSPGNNSAEKSASNMPSAQHQVKQQKSHEKNTNPESTSKPAQQPSISQQVTGNNNVTFWSSNGNVSIGTQKNETPDSD